MPQKRKKRVKKTLFTAKWPGASYPFVNKIGTIPRSDTKAYLNTPDKIVSKVKTVRIKKKRSLPTTKRKSKTIKSFQGSHSSRTPGVKFVPKGIQIKTKNTRRGKKPKSKVKYLGWRKTERKINRFGKKAGMPKLGRRDSWLNASGEAETFNQILGRKRKNRRKGKKHWSQGWKILPKPTKNITKAKAKSEGFGMKRGKNIAYA